MTRILFVCHGNICRSPMAEFIMKDIVRKAGLEKNFLIESAATTSEEIGNPVYPPVRKILTTHGIGCRGKVARLLTNADYDRYDYLIGMDRENYRDMFRILCGDYDGKIHLLSEYAGLQRDIADPWYTGDFEATWNDVLTGCEGLLKEIMQGEGSAYFMRRRRGRGR